MKRKTFYIFLGLEAAVCVLLNFTRETISGAFSTIMAFPFDQIGKGLRALSLSGDIGNVISIVLYILVCIIPLTALFLIYKKRKLYIEDSLLAITGIVLFVVIYFMVNPGLFGGKYWGVTISQSAIKAILGSIVYSLLCGYAVLRVLRLSFEAKIDKLQKYFSILLCALNIMFVYLAFGASFGGLLDSFETLRTGNTGNTGRLGMSYGFLLLQYIVDALPYILNVLVVFFAMHLLDELKTDRYSESSVAAAGKLSRICGVSLAISIVSNISFNLLQLIFFKTLAVVNSSVKLPLLSVVFVLTVLLLARFIGENKQLKDDNDMFI